MENMSILNLFSAKAGLEMPKQTPASGQGEFENVFKKYLDRSETPVNTDTAQNQKKSVKAEEPETPEEVIDSLNIPEDDKAELKRMLEEAETPEDVSAFLDKMMAMMQDAGESLENVEIAITDLAKVILGSDAEKTAKDNILLEESLDKIVEIQSVQKTTPQLSVVKNNTVQNPSDKASQPQTSGDSGQNESRKEVLLSMVEKNSSMIPEEVKAKIAEIVEKPTEGQARTDLDNGFTLKSDVTEKVIKAEIKIESPRDILKFAELVELAKNQKATTINIQLHPQELGKVNIQLTEQAGKISGKITFESENAKNLFTSNADGFRQQLADKGIAVENLEFLFKESEHHEFAGWEGREGKKSGGSSFKGHENDPEDEQETEEAEGIYA